MAETTCLLNMRARNRTGGSNPPLSATKCCESSNRRRPDSSLLEGGLEEVGLIQSISILFHLPLTGDHEIIPLSPQQNAAKAATEGPLAQLDRATAF